MCRFLVYSDERQFLIHVDPSKQKTVDPAAYDDVTLEEVQIAKDVPHYLDGCHIYLGDGVDEKRFALLKRLILVAGGTRYSDYYYGDVTHFIVHNQTLSSKYLLLPHNSIQFLNTV